MRVRPYRVSRDQDGWIVRSPDGSAVYDEDWRWNSRSTARDVARQYNEAIASRLQPSGSAGVDDAYR
ncbi:MAG: hypothetical protein J7498_01250 [Sphingobium sp.]|nr:hypothetical protein [Sphingobium sp.]